MQTVSKEPANGKKEKELNGTMMEKIANNDLSSIKQAIVTKVYFLYFLFFVIQSKYL